MNLFTAYGNSSGTTANDTAAIVESTTTNNAVLNVYQSTLSGLNYDIQQVGTNAANVYGGIFVNNTTNGTITYSGTVAAAVYTGTIENATNVAVTTDDATSATMYLTWVTALSGNLPNKASTALTWNPNSGTLGATVFSDGVASLTAGSLTGLVAVNSVVAGELEELETIGATTISAAQWAGLGAAGTFGISVMGAADEAAFQALITSPWADADIADAHSHAADSIDAITEIAAALKSGADLTLVTGTKGTVNQMAKWNTDGDAVASTIVEDGSEINAQALQFVTTGDIMGAINVSSKAGAYTIGTDDAHEAYGTLFTNSNVADLTLPASPAIGR
jgi:hypothetical protein